MNGKMWGQRKVDFIEKASGVKDLLNIIIYN
jgi:hypothetical protein